MILFLKFQFQILNKELRSPGRKPAPTARYVNETIFDVLASAEFLGDCSDMSESSWHYMELKNCPSEPNQLTKLWEIIFVALNH